MTRPWPQIYRQFGVNPTAASDKRTVQNLRAKVLRELVKIKKRLAGAHLSDGAGRARCLTFAPAGRGHAPTPHRVVRTTPYPGPERACDGRSCAGAQPDK